MDKELTVAEFAKLAGVSTSAVWQQSAKGRLLLKRKRKKLFPGDHLVTVVFNEQAKETLAKIKARKRYGK